MHIATAARTVALLTAMVPVSAASHAAARYVPNADPVLRRCEEMSPNAAVGACYLAAAAREQAKVERAFQRRVREARAMDDRTGADPKLMIPRLAAHLRVSQAVWTRYVAAQCYFEGGTRFGGSGTDMLRDECRYRLYKQRLSELDAARDLMN